ncbi:uncharacterized protein LOC115880207 [Sitophilus oryzae]|uniref:Sucrose-6-phosphate hydrolase n=1 Tax=Sitophilus oryzae TaxID=7048 RepID=A0A6J2XPC0_SITOR|nr:uncharacterized protein LOC115880207 [Sitophilus oryzae]
MRKSLVVLIMILEPLCYGANTYDWFPTFHLAPPKGWMSDPNGLQYFNGYYHFYFQHNPNSPVWGSMHWGHSKSTNMLKWEHLPFALEPSLPEDIDGIFSGSAVINDGNLTVMYTGASGNLTHQTQCLARSSDGLIFEKLGVVLKQDGNDSNFRDPRVWRQGNSWFVVIGSITENNRGEVLLYQSDDLISWEYHGVLADANETLGYMWECPDFFALGDKQILLINPQGMEQNGYDFQNLHQTGYFVGTWQPREEYIIEKGFREIDHGHDFYASQTFLAPDGRRILVSWMGMWESPFPEQGDGWAGMLTLPRELTLSEDGTIKIKPIKEVKDYRTEDVSYENSVNLNDNSIYVLKEQVSSNEIIIELDPVKSNASTYGVRLGDEGQGVSVYVDATKERLFLERSYPQFNISRSDRSVAVDLSIPIYLDIFIDNSSIEVFVNDGQSVLTSRIYPTELQRTLVVFHSEGCVTLNKYSIWNI